MTNDQKLPQINMSKLPVAGSVAGALFALATMSIFFAGVPLVRVFFPVAIAVGAGVALAFRFFHHETASTSRILS